MRFIADGPDIPNYLLKKWRNGDVLFLAGAGVSAPSNLPLFDGLALAVYEAVDQQLFETLKYATQQARITARTKVLDAADLGADRRVEANMFVDKQFDRFFSAVEKRIDPDLRGRPKTRNVRKAVEAVLSGKTYSGSHKDILRLSAQSSRDRSKGATCRVATTNFDLLFEDAWAAEFGTEALTFDARMAPRPGAHNFEGIIHLHGSLKADSNGTPNYILSSRDFARVYLRSGVIGNYVYDLIRRFTLVLVGYSADDPPMRYLMDAIGEDASLFDDMKPPFAITDLPFAIGDPRTAIEEAVWRSKEITPIFFTRRRGKNPFGPLWESLNLWAAWSRDDADWVRRQLEQHTRSRRADASAFQRGFVQDILELLNFDELMDAVRFLSARKVDFAWIDAVNAAAEATKASVD